MLLGETKENIISLTRGSLFHPSVKYMIFQLVRHPQHLISFTLPASSAKYVLSFNLSSCFKVLLVEAGGPPHYLQKVPSTSGLFMIQNTLYGWPYITTPQEMLKGKLLNDLLERINKWVLGIVIFWGLLWTKIWIWDPIYYWG